MIERINLYPYLQEGSNEIDVSAIGIGLEESNRSISTNILYERNGDLEYELIGDTYRVTGIGNADPYYLEIPSKYNEKNVTAIADRAFSGLATVMSLSIPSSITRIGAYAFSDCKQLKEVTVIDDGSGETTLREIGAFSNCEKLDVFPFGSHLYEIGEGAFYNCSLNDTFVNTLEKATDLAIIGAKAFSGTKLYGRYIPGDNLYFVMPEAFAHTKISYFLPNTTSRVEIIGEKAFYHCYNLLRARIPRRCLGIERFVFGYCENLLRVEIPEECIYIYPHAFYNCHSLDRDDLSWFANRNGWIVTPDINDSTSSSVQYLSPGFLLENMTEMLANTCTSKYFVRLKKMLTPDIYLNGSILEITDRTGWATAFNVFVNDDKVTTIDLDSVQERYTLRANTQITFAYNITRLEGFTEVKLPFVTVFKGEETGKHYHTLRWDTFDTGTGYHTRLNYVGLDEAAEVYVYEATDGTNLYWQSVEYGVLRITEDVVLHSDVYRWLMNNARIDFPSE